MEPMDIIMLQLLVKENAAIVFNNSYKNIKNNRKSISLDVEKLLSQSPKKPLLDLLTSIDISFKKYNEITMEHALNYNTTSGGFIYDSDSDITIDSDIDSDMDDYLVNTNFDNKEDDKLDKDIICVIDSDMDDYIVNTNLDNKVDDKVDKDYFEKYSKGVSIKPSMKLKPPMKLKPSMKLKPPMKLDVDKDYFEKYSKGVSIKPSMKPNVKSSNDDFNYILKTINGK
jgi:hypothetical protein